MLQTYAGLIFNTLNHIQILVQLKVTVNHLNQGVAVLSPFSQIGNGHRKLRFREIIQQELHTLLQDVGRFNFKIKPSFFVSRVWVL